jgi:hypothetical protein
MSMETIIYAVCAYSKEKNCLTMRKVKNSWPFCSCKKSMKVSDGLQKLEKLKNQRQ